MLDTRSDIRSYIEEPWKLIESYFRNQYLKRLVQHHIESYNDFVLNQIKKTMYMFNPIRVVSNNDYNPTLKKHSLEVYVSFENVYIASPQIYENNGATKIMFPQEARLRNFTYSSTITTDIHIKVVRYSGDQLETMETYMNKLEKIFIGKLPIMLRSKPCVLTQYMHLKEDKTNECKYDPGGYFIINGSEKTILPQERVAENKIFCFHAPKSSTKWVYIAEIKCVPDTKIISPKQINMMIHAKNNGYGHPIYIKLPKMKKEIPLFILFRALGVESDKDICKYIILDIENNSRFLQYLKASIDEASEFNTQEKAFQYIVEHIMYLPLNMNKDEGNKKKEMYATDILDHDIMVHCKTKEQKLYLIGYMALQLIKCFIGIRDVDDRDSYLNKRIELAGTLLNNLFRNYFNKLVKDMQKQIVKEMNTGSWRSTENYKNIINEINIYKIVKSSTIENGLKRALSTGDFSVKNVNNNKVGVAQVLNRLTYIASLSHLRRINTPIDKSGKLVPPRKLHNSSWGFICPAETPEGASVGVVKNISYMTRISIPVDSSSLYEAIYPMITELDQCTSEECFEFVKIFINGSFVGISKSPIELYNELKDKKAKGIIHIFTSIVFLYKEKEIHICNDNGRLIRPLLKVKENNLIIQQDVFDKLDDHVYSWDDLCCKHKLKESVIEYIDPAEQNSAMIAMNINQLSTASEYNFTHMEIHPSTIFGILASCIPFPEHNQSPRNTYQCISSFEEILMADGSYKRLYDIEYDDKVKTFDEKGAIHIAKVVEFQHKVAEKTMYKLEMVSGETVEATYDHKFYTEAGWKTVEEINVNTRIAMYFQPRLIYEETTDILYDVTESNDFTYEEKLYLNYKDLLRVQRGSTSLLLCKILGYLSNKGDISERRVQVHFNSKNDIEQFCIDLNALDEDHPLCQGDYLPFSCMDNENNNRYIFILEGLLRKLFHVLRKTYGVIPSFARHHRNDRNAFLSGCLGSMNVNVDELSMIGFDTPIYDILPLLEYSSIKLTMNEPVPVVLQNRIFLRLGYSYNTTMQAMMHYHYMKHKYSDTCEKINCIPYKENLSFLPVKRKTLIKQGLVTDISVDHTNMSFILRKGFCVHNCAMGKQAIGVYVSNYQDRMDKTAYVLGNPMRPLVDTRIMNIMNLNTLPSGEMVIVAIATYTGYNQEDSIIFNQGAIDRGLFAATIYKTEKSEDQKVYGDEDICCRPDKTKTKGLKFANYDKLESNGQVKENTLLENNDVIIGKVSCIKENKNDNTKVIKYKDESIVYRTNEESYLHKNMKNRNGDGYTFYKIRTRSFRKPVIGDKFSSRHGQKGTIGVIYPEEDMPFTEDGIRPDIIINPHAIPSRMTIAQLKETLLGKVLLELGLFGDGTSFNDFHVKDICKELMKCNYESHGNQMMMNGMTGEQLETSIFIGPAFYQRLKHMVTDKVHSRNEGPKVVLTRQPAEGRARDGGLRFGEMERDCMISHGASYFTKGRIYDASDKYQVYVCKKCGMFAIYNDNIHMCNSCDNITDFALVKIPYACKLLFQELKTMNVVPRILTETS